MQGIIVLGVGLLALLLFGKKAKAAQEADGAETPQPGGTDPWQVVPVQVANGEAFFDIFVLAGAFGPHERMRVLRYKEVLFQGQPRRVLVTEVGSVPEEIRARAREDFGLIQAPAAF